MSSDNGIYVLKTPKNDGFEYRVDCLSSIENYLYDESGEITKDTKIHIKNAREMWKRSKICASMDDILLEAKKIYDDYGWTEYGLVFIEINEEF